LYISCSLTSVADSSVEPSPKSATLTLTTMLKENNHNQQSSHTNGATFFATISIKFTSTAHESQFYNDYSKRIIMNKLAYLTAEVLLRKRKTPFLCQSKVKATAIHFTAV